MPLIIESDDLEKCSRPKKSKIKRIWQKLYKRYPFQSSAYSLPEPWQCKVHLKLMRAFARLHNDIIETPSEYDTTSASDQSSQLPNETAESDVQEKAWEKYVCRAAQRFGKWWSSTAIKDSEGYLQQMNMSVMFEPGGLEALLRETKPMEWTEQDLPPLDVIMAFHTFMLNPRLYLENCLRFELLPLWKAGMPWKLLDSAIDPVTFEYTVPASTRSVWTSKTRVPWKNDHWYQDLPNEGQKQINKFHRSILNLRTKGYPMRGTILDINGVARSADHPGEDPPMFMINRLLEGELGKKLLEETAWDRVRQNTSATLEQIQAEMENTLQQHHPPRLARIAVGRTMSQFRLNRSVFAFELSAAIQRQRVFIQRMEEIDWLHSPALDYTLENLIQRYAVFFKIMEQNKDRVAVPTHAVDLAWHTHQLSPSSYYHFSLANAGNVFIDHDDKMEETVLTDAFDWTCQQYSSLTNGDDYGQCLCWYCATISREMDGKTDSLERDKHGHIILSKETPLYGKVMKKLAKSQYTRLEEEFALACHRAEEMNTPCPDQESFLKSYTWSYPHAIPTVKI